ncbi:MAG: hypothetical protein A3C22_03485 [Candidatus Levybacteria bacterium RIFCSPHIGHO2_02_FULL_37_10]|nr:MAG: hypothetical protein A3C22_03485 [Candidatus Levybacteria bacterium RIFCSPHIGHO2_02_FULL_37_10]OGH41621.1 MAG: hypothetical protein A3H79_03680 [Candidatus Levybacteria bacterium RIFCSPLOWO2_02_FULL_36_8b]
MNPIKQKTSKPEWKLIEEIVAILEKSLTPDAKVEHNVWLPVVGRSGKRQCDVVIRYGKHPRQSIAIVEVQKRKAKPEITTFHGWVTKMRKVGAQHLICVSVAGYPKSVIEEVELEHGSTVRLLTLEELQKIKIENIIFPFNSALELAPKFSFKSISSVKLENPPLDKELKFTNHDKIFEIDKETNFLSLDDIASKCLNEISVVARSKDMLDLGSGIIRFILGSTTKDLWIHSGEQRFKILKLPIEVEIATQRSEIHLNCYEYKQKDVNNPLAWVISTENNSNAKLTIVLSSSSKESLGSTKTQPFNIQLSGIVLKAEISSSGSSVNKQII